jgi:hypothetical protein
VVVCWGPIGMAASGRGHILCAVQAACMGCALEQWAGESPILGARDVFSCLVNLCLLCSVSAAFFLTYDPSHYSSCQHCFFLLVLEVASLNR